MAGKYSYILAWKRIVDVIPLAVDFTFQLLPGETIQLSTVTTDVFVFAGYDSNPSAILNGQAIADPNNSNGVIQSIQAGLQGVTYGLVIWITTSTNRLISASAKISVLLDSLPANPVYIPFYYTSWPYPIEYLEQIKVSILPTAFSLLFNPRYAEQIRVSISPTSFTLTASLIVYSNYIPEQLQVSINPTSFSLTLGLIVYTIPAEQMQVAILPKAFTLTTGLVVYSTYTPEQLKVSINPVGFTLT